MKAYTRTGAVFISAISTIVACGSQGEPNVPDGGSDSGGAATSSGGKGTGAGGPGKTGGRRNTGGDSAQAGQSGDGGSTTASGGAGEPPPPGCGLDSAAFCEDFETPAPGGRGGDLDETKWAFSRWGHDSGSMFQRNPASRKTQIVWEGQTYDVAFPPTFCGSSFENLLPPDDVKICDGPSPYGGTSKQLNEVFDDQGDFGFNSMRIRQPFDFTGRTGKIVWEVDAKINPRNVGHGWWFEIWITEDPSPMPYHEAPTVFGYPRKGIGFALRFAKACPQTDTAWQNNLEFVQIMEDHHVLREINEYDTPGQCFKVADGKLNRFQLEISKDQFSFKASDYGTSELKYEARMSGLDLSFERGYVHIQHAQYNANKDGDATPVQTFRWDNIGFDGPVLPVPRTYESVDPYPSLGSGVNVGYDISDGTAANLTFKGVDPSGAKAAHIGVDVFGAYGQTLQYRINGGDWADYVLPLTGSETEGEPKSAVRTAFIDVPVDQIVSGDNKVEFKIKPLVWAEGVGNAELILDTE